MSIQKKCSVSQETFILRLLISERDDQSLRGQFKHVRSGVIYPVNGIESITSVIKIFTKKNDRSPLSNEPKEGGGHELDKRCPIKHKKEGNVSKGGLR